MSWDSQPDCYGCQINHLSQIHHMGEMGCLNNTEESVDPWLQRLKSSLDDSPAISEIEVEEIEKSSLDPGVKWAIQLPSLKRIQVVKGRFGGRFLEVRQFKRSEEGGLCPDRSKFIRLSKVTKALCGIYK